MADDTQEVSRPKGTAFFERKVQVREYESAVAGIHIGFDFDPAAVTGPDSFADAAERAFYDAKAIVFSELGIEFEPIEGKIVEKLVEKHFGTTTEIKSTGSNSQQASAPADNGGGITECENCAGPVWDNRAKKRSGQFKENAPDFTCKDKQGCGKAHWLKK